MSSLQVTAVLLIECWPLRQMPLTRATWARRAGRLSKTHQATALGAIDVSSDLVRKDLRC